MGLYNSSDHSKTVGAFVSLPPNVGIPCGDASMIGHNSPGVFQAGNYTFAFTLSDSTAASNSINAFATVVLDFENYIQINSERAAIDSVEALCPKITDVNQNISPGGIVIGFSPIILIALVGALVHNSHSAKVHGLINHSIPGKYK